ncbi:MAG: ribosome-binding factor A [Ignavibacteria bacterium RBG_16_34_14]|nr:MAG: ribosome-binding factor A [Ignavibacteria bacterium RBG_16_34_14]
MPHRVEKVENLIKQEVSLIFLRKLQDPAFGFLTVTNVKISPDLKIARVYISVFEKDKRESVLERVKSVSGFIRSELASKIRIKFVPELKFFIDDTLDYVEKIDGLIKEIHKNDNKENR